MDVYPGYIMKHTDWIDRNQERSRASKRAPRCQACSCALSAGDQGYCGGCKEEINNDLDHFVMPEGR